MSEATTISVMLLVIFWASLAFCCLSDWLVERKLPAKEAPIGPSYTTYQMVVAPYLHHATSFWQSPNWRDLWALVGIPVVMAAILLFFWPMVLGFLLPVNHASDGSKRDCVK
jgi:hypothetical protein